MGSIKRGMAAVVAASCLVLSACSGGGGGSVDIAPAPDLEVVSSTSGLKPDSNGFSFANFGSSASSEVFDENDLVEMFGETVCVDNVVDPCAPTEEAAAWARMVNDSRSVGHCEGLVVQAALRYSAKLDPQTVTLKNEGDVTHGIMRAFATQFLPEVQKSTKAWSRRSLKDIVAELVNAFKAGTTNYTLGVYSPNGGHAVLPYAVEFPTPERADIFLYDSNWPGVTRKLVVDLATDTWFFSFDNPDPNIDPSQDATAWSGNSGSIDITPMDSRSNATCPMCGEDTLVRDTILTIRSVDGDWSIKTKNGIVTAESGSDVEGVRVTSLRGALNKVTDSVVTIEAAEFDVILNSTANVYVNNVHGTAEVRTKGSKSRSPISFKENSISFTGTDADIVVARENLVVNTLISDATINIESDRIDVLTTSEGKERTIAVDAEQPKVVVTGGGEKGLVEDRSKTLNSVLPVKVDELAVPEVRGNLTARVERDLANPAYVQQYSIGASITTTTTVAEVTTTQPASATTGTTKKTTTTTAKAPGTATSTTVVSSVTTGTNTPSTTQAPVIAPVTTAVPTTAAPNQPPNISLVSCQLYSVSGSSLNLKISVVDPDGDGINRPSIYVTYSHTGNTVTKSSQGTLWTQETTPGQYALNWVISGTGGTPFPSPKVPLTLNFTAEDSRGASQTVAATISTTSCP